jgi:RNA polymerase sigma-70 factor, ECF subfamily
MDQQSLIERSLNGELNAFNQLVTDHQNLAYSVAYRLLDDTDAAGDAVQDSFIKAFRALDTFRGGSFKSWLMRIVTNTCYDVLRARQRHKTDSLEAFPVEDEYIPALIDKRESPQQYVERQELAGIITLAIQHLPEDQQISLILCDIEGYTYEEIAEISSVAIGTVKSRISRARGKVRDYLIQHPELLPLTFRPNAE